MKKPAADVVGHATEIPRDRWGRPLVAPPEGGKPVAYQRCTTFIDVLSDRYNLEQWKQRQVAIGLSRRPDLVMKAATAGDGKDQAKKAVLNQVCEAAMEAAGSSVSATIGTALHAFTEQFDRGTVPEVPVAHRHDILAYLSATAVLKMRDIEVFVVHDGLQVGGTFDRVVVADGEAYVADVKTGSIEYDTAKITMQLAVYANSLRYDVATGARSSLDVNTERGLIIHLPAGTGTCFLHWANLKQGLVGVKLAAEVRAWRKQEVKLVDFSRGTK